MTARLDRATVVGLLVAFVAMAIYWLSNRFFDAQHGDFFYLADAFLHGRTWYDPASLPVGAIGPNDVIPIGGRWYVPFAPFPAIFFMPLVAIIGPITADQWETGINAALAAIDVGLGWWLLGRLGVRSLVDRFWLVALLGFSTQIWWVTTRGGVWHTGHLIATMLTLACLIELWGSRRAWLIGLMAGAAFLSRAPIAFAVPFYALLLAGDSSGSRGAGPGGHGLRSRRASFHRSSSSSGTTTRGSGHPSSRAMPSRRCRRGSRTSARRACSRSSTSR